MLGLILLIAGTVADILTSLLATRAGAREGAVFYRFAGPTFVLVRVGVSIAAVLVAGLMGVAMDYLALPGAFWLGVSYSNLMIWWAIRKPRYR